MAKHCQLLSLEDVVLIWTFYGFEVFQKKNLGRGEGLPSLPVFRLVYMVEGTHDGKDSVNQAVAISVIKMFAS